MKLLIVTQVVDKQHPVLGFFHRWIAEFAKHCDHLHVICLRQGDFDLPSNVTVHSLGKEDGKGRFTYVWRFYKYIWSLRHEYDRVFVHMNQIYVILGASLWRILGKRIGFWYMHGSVPLSLRLAEKLADTIYSGSVESFRLISDKLVVTGHGIDTNLFKPQKIEKDTDLITVGRITESKNLLVLVDVLNLVNKKTSASLAIVGLAVTESEKRYLERLKSCIAKKGLENKVHFLGKVDQNSLPAVLNRAKVFVTAAKNGSLDKAVLEAMACGLPVVSMAEGTNSLQLGAAQVVNKKDFSNEIIKFLDERNSIEEKKIGFVNEFHSLEKLIPKILIEV
ncbi:MAG: glycosyltransferase [Candidatus Nomurabacteria bacterium]|nr:MAG: glycosyltransferase [Candidatus Nomurabacteria bacterium]